MEQIKPIKTIIDADNVLNMLGKDFNFDHAKGIAELLKNSVDAYNVQKVPDKDQKILISVKTTTNDYIKEIQVVDFCGMSKEKIDKGFIYWFNNIAASLSQEGKNTRTKTLGGHGNGGKFYMRQMFHESFLYTYYNGKMNVFGFNKNKKYGYVKDFEERKLSSQEAISISGLIYLNIPKDIEEKIISGKNGFTIIKGINPVKSKNTNYRLKLAEKIINNPQAERLIKSKKIYFLTFPNNEWVQLNSSPIKPKTNFEKPLLYKCPDELKLFDNIVSMVNKKYKESIYLNLFTSSDPLTNLNNRDKNRIDFLGKLGVIASYHISQLGSFSTGYTEFIYGECYCPIMEDINDDYVKNDRVDFVKGERSEALLMWVYSCINDLSKKLSDEQKKNKREQDLKDTSNFNKILNTWNQNFINEMMKNQLFGNELSPGVGGDDEYEPVIGDKKGHKTKGAKKKKGNKGGDQSKKTLSHPTILISSRDIDPLSSDGSTFDCDPRQSAVYQRYIDVPYKIYWINTSRKLAEMILRHNSADSTKWRNYLFQRHIDVIIKETIFQMGKKELNLSSDNINNEIDKVISSVQDKAVIDLKDFLFDENYKL